MRLAGTEKGHYADRLSNLLRIIPASHGAPRFQKDNLAQLFERALSGRMIKPLEQDHLLEQLIGDDRALLCLGIWLVNDNRIRDASTLLPRFARSDAEHVLAAALAWQQRDLRSVIHSLSTAVERNARIPGNCAALGLAFAASGNKARAIYHLYQAVRNAPSRDDFYDDLLGLLSLNDERRLLIVSLRDRQPGERSKWIAPINAEFNEPDDKRYAAGDEEQEQEQFHPASADSISDIPPVLLFSRVIDSLQESADQQASFLEISEGDWQQARTPAERAHLAAMLYHKAKRIGDQRSAIRWLGSYAFSRGASFSGEDRNQWLLAFLFCSYYCNSDTSVREAALANILRSAQFASGPDSFRQIQLFVRLPASKSTIWAARLVTLVPELFSGKTIGHADRMKLLRAVLLDPAESVEGKIYCITALLPQASTALQMPFLRSTLSLISRIQGIHDYRDQAIAIIDFRHVLETEGKSALTPILSDALVAVADQLEGLAKSNLAAMPPMIGVNAALDQRAGGAMVLSVRATNEGNLEARNLVIEVRMEDEPEYRTMGTIDSLAPFTAGVVDMTLDLAQAGTEILCDIRMTSGSAQPPRSVERRLVVSSPGLGDRTSPMENPYLTGMPIPPGNEMFFGRTKELIKLSNLLSLPRTSHVPLVYGQRRTGKTSLLNRLSVEPAIASRYQFCLIDCERIAGQHTGDLVSLILGDLYEAVRVPIEKRLSEEEIKSSPLPSLASGLSKLAPTLPRNQRLLIAIDEFEVLLTGIRDGRIAQDVLSVLRSFIQHEARFSFVLAGADQLVERVRQYASPLFALARPIQLPYLGESDVRDLMTKPTQGIVDVDSDVIAELLLLTGGHPYLSQLIGYYVIEGLNDAGRRRITSIDIDRSGELIIGENDAFFYELFHDRCSYEDRLVLSAAADLGKQHRRITYDALYRLLRTPSFSLRPEILGDLHDRQLLRYDSHLRYCEFTLELFRRWISQRHPLESLKAVYV